MNKDELIQEINDVLNEVNRPLKVDSPLFLQKAYDFSDVVSRAGKLWAKVNTFYQGKKVEFEIWEAATEISIRSFLEAKNEAREKQDRITESKVAATVKQDRDYKSKKMELIEAEELYNLVEKAVYEACKLRGYVSNAIVKKKDDR